LPDLQACIHRKQNLPAAQHNRPGNQRHNPERPVVFHLHDLIQLLA
jgi:hypothetical protein